MMFRPALLSLAGLIVSSSLCVAATTIDTSNASNLFTNLGYAGSGQSLTVPTDNVLVDFSVYADTASAGKVFGVIIRDAINGGTTLFTTSINVVAGLNTFFVNQTFTAGSTIFVQFDYNGFTGRTLQYAESNPYSGGTSTFREANVNNQSVFSDLDHRFIANFASGTTTTTVPDGGATVALLGLSMGGVAWLRRKVAAGA